MDIDKNEVIENEAVEEEALDAGDVVDEASEIMDEETCETVTKRRGVPAIFRIDPKYNKLLPISLLAGLIGLILGPIPSVVYVLISDSSSIFITGDVTGNTFYPFFMATPLIIFLFNSLFKGGRDVRALIVTAVFSLAGAYLTALMSIMTTFYTIGFENTFFKIFTRVFEAIGRLDYLSITLNPSAYVYPLIFTALGVVIAAILNRSPGGIRSKSKKEEDAEDNEEDDLNSECAVEES